MKIHTLSLIVLGCLVLTMTGCEQDIAVLLGETNTTKGCSNNIKFMGIGFATYSVLHKNLPPSYSVDENGTPLHSWRVLILPYIDEMALYEQIRLDEPWDSEHNKQFHARMPKCYACPGAPKKEINQGLTYYTVIVGEETPFPGPGRNVDWNGIPNKQNQLAVVERQKPVCWMCPDQEITYENAILGFGESPDGIGTLHGNECVCGSIDGSPTVSEAPIGAEELQRRFKINKF